MRQEILSKVDIYDYISTFVSLKEKSKGQYLGLCPFHHEKTPSFSVNRDKQFFYCFGCKAGGDIVKFTMLIKGIPFDVAIKTIAQDCNISLHNKAVESHNTISLDVNRSFAEKCNRLIFDPKSHYGIDYIRARGIKDSILNQYMLGYLPSNRVDEVLEELSKDFSEQEILKSGIFKHHKDNTGIYSPFAGRIIFPIHKDTKTIVGFGSRIIKADTKSVKYLNSAESDFFHKSELLYGLEQLKQTHDTIFVVEGYMDAISLANYGIHNAVGVLGSNLSEIQMQRLWRYTNKPTICFDNDQAGRGAMLAAAKKAILFIQPGKSLQFLNLHDAKDPDEFIRRNGAEAFMSLYNQQRVSLAEYIYANTAEGLSLNNPDDVVILRQRLADICNSIGNNLVQNEYHRYFEKILYTSTHYKTKKYDTPMLHINNIRRDKNIEIEMKICKIIAEQKCLLLDQEILDDFMHCHFYSESANNIRIELTHEILDKTMGEASETMRNQLKCLFLSLKITNLQKELVACGKNEEFDAKMLELKKYQIELQKQLSSKLS